MFTLSQANEKLEDLRGKLNDPGVKLSNETILLVSNELQPLYKRIIMSNLDEAVARRLEGYLWNDCFKTPLAHFGRTDKTLFNLMIESGAGFYMSFIQDVGFHFDIPFIKSSTRSLYCTTPAKAGAKSNPLKANVYYIIQNSLLRVGDLLRYRGSLVEALKMYEKSAAVNTLSGHPYNQMAVTQLVIDNRTIDSFVAAVYYYVRALSVEKPFELAFQSMSSLLMKMQMVSPTTESEEFLCQLLSALNKTDKSNQESLTTVLSPLISMSAISNAQLFRIICITLWYWKKESVRTLHTIDSGDENYFLNIMLSLFNAILVAAIGFPDYTTFYALPHLKMLIDWLSVSPTVLNNETFRKKLHVELLCNILNQLVLDEKVNHFNLSDFGNVILPEEKKLLGFLPMGNCYESVQVAMEETDMRIIPLRICRMLKTANTLCQERLRFIERDPDGTYSEVVTASKCSNPAVSSSMSYRRNVALESIFQNMPSPTEPWRSNGAGYGNYSSGSPLQAYETGVMSSDAYQVSTPADMPPMFAQAEVSPSSTITTTSTSTGLSTASDSDGSNTYAQLFQSIWTPFGAQQPQVNRLGDWKP